MFRVVITGGSGLVGTELTSLLLKEGFDVTILSRQKKANTGRVRYVTWNVEAGKIDKDALSDADYIVHLAGANVAEKRWTQKRKEEIINSRVKSCQLLVNTLREVPNHVQAVISSSATGWYGEDEFIPNPKPFTEQDRCGHDFLSTTCRDWEDSIQPIQNMGIRLVVLRTGIALSTKGGAFKEFLKPLKFGLNTILGSGNQMISWIHMKDLVNMYLYCLKNNKTIGVYNAVAPYPVSNQSLMLALERQSGKSCLKVKAPAWALKIILGEMSIEVLKSCTVSSQKIEREGFHFHYQHIDMAIKDLLTGEH